MSPLVDTRAVTIVDPTDLPASFVGLELLVMTGALLTMLHAVRARRAGDRAAVLTWVTVVVYGLAMEFLSYNLVDNFAHGLFTISFYDQQLPLYIVGVYPVLLYTGIATARRLGLPPLAEACAAGVLIVCMDVPFDIAGPVAGWWSWFDNDPNIAHRWLGVPVTSYYWHMMFGGILAGLTSLTARRSVRATGPSLWWSAPLSVAVVLLGLVSFLPFHLGTALGISDGVMVGLGFGSLLWIAATAAVRRLGAGRLDRLLVGSWLSWYGFHLLVVLALGAGGARLGFIAGAATIALAASLAVAVRRRPRRRAMEIGST